jgi:peptide deformylase
VILEIVQYPDARLATPCEPVADVAAVVGLISEMFETMYAAPGRGLAAPQVGVLARVFVMDAGWKSGTKTPRVCINPEIVTVSKETVTGPEGCLSAPGIEVQLTRPARITLDYTDQMGVRQREDLTGFDAICAQHELDHLDGTMHFDRLDAQTRAGLIQDYEATL